jgi:hypothetical protein
MGGRPGLDATLGLGAILTAVLAIGSLRNVRSK